MKKWILIGLLAAVSVNHGFAGSREDLMARMGFSQEEIAKDIEAHNALTGTLDVTGGKSDPKAAALALREASEINQLRASRALRQQAESLVAQAANIAAQAKVKQEEAGSKAEVAARETRKMIFNDGISAQTYSQALDGRDKFLDAAREARAVAEAEARKAEKARVAADAIIAKANAAEGKLEKERLARVVASPGN